MDNNGNSHHARLFFHPSITVTAEAVADKLDLTIEKADQLLSRPVTHDIIREALDGAFQETIFRTLREMVRIPHESVPVRQDCAVGLPSLPMVQVFSKF